MKGCMTLIVAGSICIILALMFSGSSTKASQIEIGKSYLVITSGVSVKNLADSGEAVYDISNSTQTFLARTLTKRYGVVNAGETVNVKDINGEWVQVRITKAAAAERNAESLGTTDKRFGLWWIQARTIE